MNQILKKHGYPNPTSHAQLRESARDLIQHGVAPRHNGSILSSDALHFLYKVASEPDSAANALKLLHELQTYQVELDLLNEQIRANEHEISEELAYYQALYEQAPAAYLTVATDGQIIEGNEAAGLLFGKSKQALTGKILSKMLAPEQEGDVRTLLSDAMTGKSRTHNVANGFLEFRDHRWLAVSAKSSAAGDCVLMIMNDVVTHSAKF